MSGTRGCSARCCSSSSRCRSPSPGSRPPSFGGWPVSGLVALFLVAGAGAALVGHRTRAGRHHPGPELQLRRRPCRWASSAASRVILPALLTLLCSWPPTVARPAPRRGRQRALPPGDGGRRRCCAAVAAAGRGGDGAAPEDALVAGPDVVPGGTHRPARRAPPRRPDLGRPPPAAAGSSAGCQRMLMARRHPRGLLAETRGWRSPSLIFPVLGGLRSGPPVARRTSSCSSCALTAYVLTFGGRGPLAGSMRGSPTTCTRRWSTCSSRPPAT